MKVHGKLKGNPLLACTPQPAIYFQVKPSTVIWLAAGAAAIIILGAGGAVVVNISSKGQPYLSTIKSAAAQYGVPWELIYAQLWAESDFDPNAVSSAGAQGIAQFEPGTAAAYGLTNPFDPTASIYAEAHLLSDLYAQFGSWSAALAAYNWGPGNVQSAQASYGSNWLAYAPMETQNYVPKILGAAGISA